MPISSGGPDGLHNKDDEYVIRHDLAVDLIDSVPSFSPDYTRHALVEQMSQNGEALAGTPLVRIDAQARSIVCMAWTD